MFKNTYQNGLLSIFYSCGSNPLAIWDMEVKNGHIKRLTDNEVNSIVLEIVSTNVATTYITCPKNNQVLGIKLPFLVMIVKNLKRYFSFEITILDDKNLRRRFRISNFQSTTKIKPFCTTMPIGLAGGWNQIQFNLADFTRRAYGTQFIETLRVQVHANARLRRIYFSEKLYTEEELPQEYKLYLPLERKQKKGKKEAQSTAAAAPTKDAAPSPASEPQKKKSISKAAEPEKTKEVEGPPPTEEAAPAEAVGETGEEQAVEKVKTPEEDTGEPEAGGVATTEGETPAESEAPPESKASVEGEVPTEGEAPAKGEAPVGGEAAVEGKVPAVVTETAAGEVAAVNEAPAGPTESVPASAEGQ